MTKSIYEIWLSQGKDKLRLPVLPEEIQIGNGASNDSINIAGLGELTIIQDGPAKTFSFESFFPAKYSPLCEYKKIPKPWDAIKKIEKWKKSGKPIRLIVTKTPINVMVSIEDFPHGEGKWDVKDIGYTLALKEYKYVTVRKVTKKKKTNSRPDTKGTSKTHKVKKGDTLWALARKYYGSGLKWKKIWNVPSNKKMLISEINVT